MAKLYVEGWSPEYGSPFDPDDGLAEPGKVDEAVEVDGRWSPIAGVDDGVARIAFVDGVRRIDARLTLDDVAGPIAGICGTFAVGAVCWDRTVPRSEVEHERIERLAVFGHGRAVPVPVAGPQLAYRSEAVPDVDPQALIQRFHGAMRKAEAVLFLIGKGGAFPRYSWYLKLAALAGGHTWTGVVRAEVSSHLPVDLAVKVANRTTAVLPLVASQPHVDPRAPQNLVPIAALERLLRNRMGDPAFIHRALRSAVMAQDRELGAAS